MEGLKKTQRKLQAKIDKKAANAAAAALREEEGAGDEEVDEGGEGGGEAADIDDVSIDDATATDTVTVDEDDEGSGSDGSDEGHGSDGSDGKGRQRPLSASSVQTKPFFFEADTDARKADNYTKKCDEIL